MQGLGSGLLPANGLSPLVPTFISESYFSLLFCGTPPSGQFVVGLVQHLAPEQGPEPWPLINIRVFSSELTLHIRCPKY